MDTTPEVDSPFDFGSEAVQPSLARALAHPGNKPVVVARLVLVMLLTVVGVMATRLLQAFEYESWPTVEGDFCDSPRVFSGVSGQPRYYVHVNYRYYVNG